MAFDNTGKYHMNPHHAKMADASKPQMKAPDPDAGTEDQESPMVTCPSCGDTFPLEQGLAQPETGHGAVPTHESGHAMSGGY